MTLDTKDGRSVAFYTGELSALLSGSPGPVEAFVLGGEYDLALKQRAIATGTIPRGAFAKMAIFDNSERSRHTALIRREVKVGSEVMRILSEDDDAHDAGGTHARAVRMAARLHARQETNHAVVVEAARKMHRETAEGELDSATAALYGRELDAAQAELYPEVDQAVVDSILAEFAGRFNAVDIGVLPDDQQEFLADFSDTYTFAVQEREVAALPELSPERVAEFSQELRRRFQPALDKIRQELGDLTVDNMPQATNMFMREIGMPMASDPSDHTGWLSEPKTDFAGYKTTPSARRLPRGRFSKISWDRFGELMIHEAIFHGLRSENGAASGVEALRTGLTGNASFEEGVALLAERLYRGTIDNSLDRDDFRYLAIAYADGKVDGKPHTETETFQFVSTFMAANQLCKGTDKSSDSVLKANRSLAYDHTKRAYRGMPPGKTHHSNLSYKQGKIDAVAFLCATDAPAAVVLDYLLQAKFNPLDPEHRQVLAELGLQAEVTSNA